MLESDAWRCETVEFDGTILHVRVLDCLELTICKADDVWSWDVGASWVTPCDTDIASGETPTLPSAKATAEAVARCWLRGRRDARRPLMRRHLE
ncbi:MAG: hypothetical protein OXU20_17325 [Myxococcales bacterium]|nr:hypothetical protein [Myxococcales bacterium]